MLKRLKEIFFPSSRAGLTREPSKKSRSRKSYERTGKHYWYAVTSDGLDMVMGRFKSKGEALRAAKAQAKSMGRGSIIRVYHLDD